MVGEVRPYSLRHGYATEAVAAGVNYQDLGRLWGSRDAAGTDRVYLLSPVRLDGGDAEGAPRLWPWTGRGPFPSWSLVEHRPRPATSLWPWRSAVDGWPSHGPDPPRPC